MIFCLDKRVHFTSPGRGTSPPARGRGLKHICRLPKVHRAKSPPARGRGLKLMWSWSATREMRVAPRAGIDPAWSPGTATGIGFPRVRGDGYVFISLCTRGRASKLCKDVQEEQVRIREQAKIQGVKISRAREKTNHMEQKQIPAQINDTKNQPTQVARKSRTRVMNRKKINTMRKGKRRKRIELPANSGMSIPS